MTAEHISAIVREFERRWRERTPARDVTEALPTSKVPWSEIHRIAGEITGDSKPHIMDRIAVLEVPIRKKLRQLRREFPDLQW